MSDKLRVLKDKPCAHCGQTMQVISSRQVYCNRYCMSRSFSIKMVGSGSSTFKDPSLYSPSSYGKFWSLLAELIRVRDEQICILCAATAGARELSVHHIDHNPLNNDPENLITLCQSCHRSHHNDGEQLHEFSTIRLKNLAVSLCVSMTFKLRDSITSLQMEFCRLTV